MDDLQREVLQLLRLHDERGTRGLLTLSDLVSATERPERWVRRVCDALETVGYIKGLYGSGSDWNPDYEITVLGKAALYRDERGSTQKD